MDPPSEKVEIISVCSGVFRTATSASMLPSDDTPCPSVSGYLKYRWPRRGPMSVRRATHVRGGYHHESSALIMMRDIFSLCALVLLDVLFICGQRLASQADSGCSQCQIGPDTSGAGWIIIVCHVQIGRGKQTDRFTHLCM